ncbi:M-phase-specific PLK1-interacting protein [Odontesthes bonariensis]|uniref:M-phase-specific PLK1-interacting protein n=1 Tax=Odontesthes bonariensis TaxID=219752 RepID=UPI003F5897DE
MYRTPVRPQQSPGAPRPAGRFPSPAPCWGFPGARSPFSGHRGGSPRGCRPYAPGSPVFSPGSNRGYADGSPAGFGSGSRDFTGQMRRRGNGFRRPPSFSPTSAPNSQSAGSEVAVEKFFSPSMLQDPWQALQPVCAAAARRST